MAQYSVPQNDPDRSRMVRERGSDTPGTSVASEVASPAPLGLGMIGILTAILGCFYTGFIIPFDRPGLRVGVGIAMLIGGIILVLAGMWEFRKGYLLTATTFTSYGGFLGIVGLVFLPASGVLAAVNGDIHLFMGLIFLCWTIFLGILTFGASRTTVSLTGTLGLLFVAYFFLMLGSLASDNTILLKIGGWFAIASALVAWIASLASILSTGTGREAYRLPLGDRLAVVE